MNYYYSLTLPVAIETIFLQIVIRSYKNLPFSTSLPLLLCELIKIVMSFLSMKTYHKQVKKTVFVSLLFTIQNLLLMHNSAKVNPVLYQILFQSRVIFVGFLSIFMLQKRYNILEIFGLLVVFIALVISGFSEYKSRDNNYFAAFLILIAGISSSVGTIYFEKTIRKNITDFFGYYFVNSISGVLIYIIYFIYEFYTQSIIWTLNVQSETFYFLVTSLFVNHSLITIFSSNVCSVKRFFLSTAISNFSGVFLNLLLGKKITSYTIISLIFLNVGILLFEHKNIIKLFKGEKKKIKELD